MFWLRRTSYHKFIEIGKRRNISKIERPKIYSAKCSAEKCNSVYISQTIRNLKTRATEHIKCIDNNEPRESSIAEHCDSIFRHFDTICLFHLLLAFFHPFCAICAIFRKIIVLFILQWFSLFDTVQKHRNNCYVLW